LSEGLAQKSSVASGDQYAAFFVDDSQMDFHCPALLRQSIRAILLRRPRM
jgi:hypothetical protein